MNFQITKTSLVTYFTNERRWYYTGVGSSLVSLIAALSFLSIPEIKFLHGVAYLSIGFSILELIICLLTLLKSRNDIARISDIIRNHPERIRIDEFPRVRKVLRNLMVIKFFTILMAVAGIGMFVLIRSNSLIAGMGLGLFIQSIFLYGVDHFALKGRLLYWNFLQSTYRFHQINLGFKFPSEHTS